MYSVRDDSDWGRPRRPTLLLLQVHRRLENSRPCSEFHTRPPTTFLPPRGVCLSTSLNRAIPLHVDTRVGRQTRGRLSLEIALARTPLAVLQAVLVLCAGGRGAGVLPYFLLHVQRLHASHSYTRVDESNELYASAVALPGPGEVLALPAGEREADRLFPSLPPPLCGTDIFSACISRNARGKGKVSTQTGGREAAEDVAQEEARREALKDLETPGSDVTTTRRGAKDTPAIDCQSRS